MTDALVDEAFYKDSFYGQAVPDGQWYRYEHAAEMVVNEICRGFFDAHGLADLQLATDSTRIKNAICAQIEFYVDQGGVTYNERVASNAVAKSFSIGNFSVTGDTGSVSELAKTKAIDPRVYAYVRPTGLLYGGVC